MAPSRRERTSQRAGVGVVRLGFWRRLRLERKVPPQLVCGVRDHANDRLGLEAISHELACGPNVRDRYRHLNISRDGGTQSRAPREAARVRWSTLHLGSWSLSSPNASPGVG